MKKLQKKLAKLYSKAEQALTREQAQKIIRKADKLQAKQEAQ
jgi:hypothetical protein